MKQADGSCKTCAQIAGAQTDDELKALTLWDPMLGKCVASCPDNRPDDKSTGICQACSKDSAYWEPMTGKCTAKCLMGATVEKDSPVCKSCDAPAKYWDPLRNECTAACLSKDTPLAGLVVCKTCNEVSTDTPFYDPLRDGGKCVDTCKETNVNGICTLCKAIDASAPLWESGKCMSCAENNIANPFWA